MNSSPFFYETSITPPGTHLTLGEETSRHCIQVLRMKTGEPMRLTDGQGNIYGATILSEHKKNTVVTIDTHTIVIPPARKTCIAIALLKNASRFEWFLEKATEIGVTEIQPLITHHTEHTRFRHDRMNGILISAMLQSQQAWLPLLHEPVAFNSYVASAPHAQKLVAHCEEDRKQLIRELPPSDNAVILIGPEGDFSKEEIKLALQKGFLPVSLGDTRLRAETAGMLASVLLVHR